LVVFAPAYLKHVRHVRAGAAWPVVFVSYPCLARGRVISYLVAWPYRRARARTRALIFCDHCFDCHGLPFVYCHRTELSAHGHRMAMH
jgi:hypothetical protein